MPDGEEKLKSADRPTPKPPVSPATEPVWQWLRRIGLLSVALTVVLVLSSVALPVGTAMPLPTPAPSGVSPPGGSWISQGPTTTLSPGFFGADVRPYYALDPFVGGFLNSSAIHLVRWPGGAIADRYNLTANRIYADSGSSYSPPSNASRFTQWCRSAHCHAIIQLPAEIASPSTAAYYVAYTETTLQFHPDYWEIGNEPAGWTHFGFSWDQWNPSQGLNASPASYARTVQTYVTAVKAVDPNARIIGLPGVGTGAYGETGWIRATVALNGPNLSGVAIHAYPAGLGPSGTATLAGFDQTLTGAGSLTKRVPQDRQAILQACPNCQGLSLLVTELGSAIEGGSYQPFLAGFAEVPYITAEVIQAMSLNLSTIALFAAQSTYPGSLLNPQETPMILAPLYQSILPRVQHVVLPGGSRTLSSGLSFVESQSFGSTLRSVLATNTNATTSVQVPLGSMGFPLSGGAMVWSWDASSSQPHYQSHPGHLGANWTLAPQSVLLIIASFPTPLSVASHPTNPGVFSGASMAYVIALFGLVAPTGLTLPCWATLIPRVGRARFRLPQRAVVSGWIRDRL